MTNSPPKATSTSIAARDLPYDDGDARLHGRFFWDETHDTPRPGILLVHGGAGLDDHACDQARRYAELGYAVLACDMFGEDVKGDRERIMATLMAMRDDPDHLVRRAQAGLDALGRCPEAGVGRAVVGFCFGGMAALTLAREGAGLAGAVSVHGTLATSRPAETGAVKARILVCHGAADPHVPMSDVAVFAEEMNRAGADWQLTVYGRAQHGFTHTNAVPGSGGVAYDRATDERSFAAIRTFLADVLD
ncbi:dienelactone hydrolase family protein [Actinoallomurus sp. CA-142502]|uniref:dienelactone hydrolase family protein n=1 Tax=Actinoallomurus sp. CA-142502 TaxID=3239885 RepID=UPI003D8AA615